MERVKGIEPSSQAWEAHILPLNHTRIPKALSSISNIILTFKEEVGGEFRLHSVNDSVEPESDRDGGLDGRIGLVADQLKIFVFKIADVAHVGVDFHPRQAARFA